MQIINSSYIFTEYFLRTGDIEPVLDGKKLTIYNSTYGRGNKFTGVTNIVAYTDDNLTSILCAWHCRHGGSQFWRHYRNDERVTWKSLTEAERMLILDAFGEPHVPGWANLPGKLERDYIRGRELFRAEMDEQGTLYGYKYLRLDEDGLYHSPATVAKNAAWENLELTADREPTAKNTHGIYCTKSRKSPALGGFAKQDCHMVKLILSGTIVEGETGFRAQHAQIVEVL